jgi:hypothetical protein
MQSFLTPTHFTGPAEVLDDAAHLGLWPTETSALVGGTALANELGLEIVDFASSDILSTTLTRLKLGRFDPLSTLSIMLKVNELYEEEKYALVQCIARFVERDGRILVTRVCTHRLAVAATVGEYLDAADDEIVPVVLGKEAVFRAVHGRELNVDLDRDFIPDADRLERRAYAAQSDLDATIQRISGAFRMLGLQQGSRRFDLTEDGHIKAAGSSFDFAFPPELADTLRRLYHFRRGLLLSPEPLLSNDNRCEMRSLFLRLPLEDCLCMMALSVWSVGLLKREETTAPYRMESVPPETMSLWNDVSTFL